jgi:type IV pilus assembly protein PilN
MFRKILAPLKQKLSKLLVQQEDVVGVDIMPGYIRIAELEQSGSKWTVTKIGYRYVEGQIDTDDLKNNPTGYSEKLQQVCDKNKITTKNAAVSIPVSNAVIQVVSLPLMTDEELDQAIKTDSLWDNVVQLPGDIDDYSIFHQIIKRHNNENLMDLLFVASKMSDIEDYMGIVRQAGLSPVVVDVRCFSLRNALDLKKNLNLQQPIAILEFGPYENYILILDKQGAPFIAEIYISDLDKESLGKPPTDSTEDFSGLFQRYAMQVSQVVSSYQSKYNATIAKIYVASTLPSISEAVEQFKIGLPDSKVEAFNPFADIRVPANIEKKISAEPNTSMFAAVLGLATRKLDVFGYYQYVTGTNNINLLPNRDALKAKEKARAFSKYVLIFITLIVIAGAGWSFFTVSEKKKSIETQMLEYELVAGERDQLSSDVDSLSRKINEISGLLEASSDLSSNQKYMFDLLAHINASIIGGIALDSVTYQDGVVDIVGKSLSDQNIIEFNSKLDDSPLIRRASLQTMSVSTEGGINVKNFSLRCVLGEPVEEEDPEG